MQETDDIALLERYASGASEEAFAVVVSRYVNLVYSAALRQAGNPHHAEEITQAVFIILAKKARSLRKGTILSGWLCQTARLTAANLLRTEMRRARREREACMQSLLNEPESDVWAQIAPLLDAALGSLGEKDRNAVVLRFFTGQKLSEVGAAMGTSEEAAKKRVNRAVEKLRHFFTRRGVVLPEAALTAAISAYSVQAAPANLAVAATGATASTATLALIKITLSKMVWMKLKTAVAAGTAVLLAAGIATVAVGRIHSSSLIEDALRNMDTQSLEKAPAVLVLRPTQYPGPVDKRAWSRKGFAVQNTELSRLFSIAYAYPWWSRVVPATDMPQGQYDLLLTLTDNPMEALRQEIRRQLGLVAHRETRMTDILVLELDPGQVERFKTSQGGNRAASFPEWQASGVRKLALTNQPCSFLAQILEGHLGAPVFDRTGLPGKYDLMLQWPGQREANAEVHAIQQAVSDQLGLRLISKQEIAELLVVERAGR